MEMTSGTERKHRTIARNRRAIRRCGFLVSRVFALLLIAILGAKAQTNTSPPSKAQAPAASAPSKPSTGMLTGQGNNTLLQSPKSNSGALRTPPLSVGADVERMSHDQFRALPDAAILHYRGQSMSKAAFIQLKLNEGGTARPSLLARKPMLSFEALKAQFQQKQASDLQAQNARVQAVIDHLNIQLKRVQGSSQYLALVKEASALRQRYGSASPHEQSRLKVRALQIHQELTRLETVE